MRIKKWEKYYWSIIVSLLALLFTWIILREKGLEAIINGEKKTLSKTYSFLLSGIVLLLNSLIIWAGFRFCFLKTNDFVCKNCHKEFGSAYETEKNLCKSCFEKKYNKKSL